MADSDPVAAQTTCIKGSFANYVISKGERGSRNDYANVIFSLSNAEFDGRGEGV